MSTNRWVLCVAAWFSTVATVDARTVADDPLDSVMWQSMVERFMPDGDVRFDERVKVLAPVSAEDQFQVPVTIDASGIDDVVEIVAIADLNPIPLILRFEPESAQPFIGFRLKLQQGSPIHVGVRTGAGDWLVGGTYVDAAGGGCTAPAEAHGQSNWMDRLGETRARVIRGDSGESRMTLRIRHPMDTGLADGIPVFYLERLTVRGVAGETLANVELYEPVSENPTLTLKPLTGPDASELRVSARDTEGNRFAFALPVPASP